MVTTYRTDRRTEESTWLEFTEAHRIRPISLAS